ncbi:MAG TPA: HPr family phosphocarrier protein [Candidatus Avichristensenella intestinipullorum]|uniref:HPr family phosphocarrier protein n=1 Tax=Candidatus Avichristensenella intestinipullorum TaxID=2840693 RepID=A0A9D0YUV2_9FIRM|nr:HPr family phosphocarrier protein [Candidatus Avichristensenella intestinipullorum]
MRLKINLETQTDVLEFCKIASNLDGDIRVVGHDHGQECSVNAKSLLGLLYSTTWNDIWCVSDNDIYSHISKFAAD